MTFADFFNSKDGKEYGERLGYTFKSLSFDTTQTTVDLSYNNNKYSSNNIYNKSYPVHKSTTSSATFTWTAETGKNISLQLVRGINNDGGSDTADFKNLPTDLIKKNINNLSNASSDASSTGFDNTYKATLTGLTSGSVTFNITILDGYSLQIDGNDSSVAFDGSSITATGKHDEENGYQTSGTQQDSYNLITGSHSCTTLDDGNKVYTITIDNIVGEGGTLNIRVVRDSIETQLKINLQAMNGNLPNTPPELKAYYTINGLDTDKDGLADQIELCAEGNHSGNYVNGVFTIDFSYKKTNCPFICS